MSIPSFQHELSLIIQVLLTLGRQLFVLCRLTGWIRRVLRADPHRLTTGDVARRVGCRQWQVRRLCKQGRYPEAHRIGRQWVFRESELSMLKRELHKAGYLK